MLKQEKNEFLDQRVLKEVETKNLREKIEKLK